MSVLRGGGSSRQKGKKKLGVAGFTGKHFVALQDSCLANGLKTKACILVLKNKVLKSSNTNKERLPLRIK